MFVILKKSKLQIFTSFRNLRIDKTLFYLVFLSLIFNNSFNAQVVSRDLSKEKWTFSQQGKNDFLPAKVLGTVHTDLLQNKRIPDPFFGDNEKKLQWIEEENWVYKTNFNLSEKEFQNAHINLIFNGLDTFADVFLNEKKILFADNMFRTWKVDAKKFIKKGNNTLEIIFYSASKKGKELAKQLPYKLPENERVFVRKAQYHFGWDWGPRFVTAGIWKPVILELWNDAKIESVKFTQETSPKKAKIKFVTTINAEFQGLYDVKINEKLFRVALKKGENIVSNIINIDRPKLWYPNGYGEPHLYPFKISLSKYNNVQKSKTKNLVLDKKSLNIGLRTIELIQEKDEVGKSFYFKVNGIPIYAKGANVIPAHSFIPSADKNIYKNWMKEAKFANMNMLRVWGGGIYEDDEFYNEADKNGILVWQDFMFACAMYPADENFLKNVKNEVIDQANRLQNHASLAIWCGNNENDEGWNNWGWQKQLGYTKQDSAKVWKDYVKIFREIIPKTLDSVSAQKPIYWQSSPSNGWGRDVAYKEGDVHYWGVWWGMEPFEKYREKTGRFVSEYGFQGMPPISTFLKITDKETLRQAQGDKMFVDEGIKNHQKHGTGYETITKYMERDYKVPQNFEDFAYVSQLLQAHGLKIAVEAHRQRKPYNMGTLYWQFNDVWPVTSWSSLDFFGNRKAAHYQFKRSFEPLLLTVLETEKYYEIFATNDLLSELNGGLNLDLIDFFGKNLWNASGIETVKTNTAHKIAEIEKSVFNDFDLKKTVLKITFNSKDGNAETLFYFAKPKDLVLEKPTIKTRFINDKTVEISTNVLAKDVYLISDEAGNFDDNFFDLLAGEKKVVSAEKAIKNLKILTLFDVQ